MSWRLEANTGRNWHHHGQHHPRAAVSAGCRWVSSTPHGPSRQKAFPDKLTKCQGQALLESAASRGRRGAFQEPFIPNSLLQLHGLDVAGCCVGPPWQAAPHHLLAGADGLSRPTTPPGIVPFSAGGELCPQSSSSPSGLGSWWGV